MPLITGKTLYILGAGASQHTGAPLLRDFLFTARLLAEGRNTLRHKQAFDLVFSWIDALRGSSYYVELDLNNLEHIFSLAEMERQIDPQGGNDVVKELRYVVAETLDNACRLQFEGRQLLPDRIYGKFVENLVSLNENRKKIVSNEASGFSRDAVITFNYDVMLDNAIVYHALTPEYYLSSPPDGKSLSRSLKLLKLHGSVNWGHCSKCQTKKDYPQILSPIPLSAGSSVFPRSEHDEIFFKMATEILFKTPCSSCQQKGTLEPFLIPPTWSKKIDDTAATHVWKTAVEEIADASQIIVIGYSMPRTDTFFQYLLTLGLARNAKLHRIVVVDIDESAEFRVRYENVLARGLRARGCLKFLTPQSFTAYVERPMKSIATQTEWPYSG